MKVEFVSKKVEVEKNGVKKVYINLYIFFNGRYYAINTPFKEQYKSLCAIATPINDFNDLGA